MCALLLYLKCPKITFASHTHIYFNPKKQNQMSVLLASIFPRTGQRFSSLARNFSRTAKILKRYRSNFAKKRLKIKSEGADVFVFSLSLEK